MILANFWVENSKDPASKSRKISKNNLALLLEEPEQQKQNSKLLERIKSREKKGINKINKLMDRLTKRDTNSSNTRDKKEMLQLRPQKYKGPLDGVRHKFGPTV